MLLKGKYNQDPEVAEMIQLASVIKEFGTGAFKCNDYVVAADKYAKAVRYLNAINPHVHGIYIH